jgi:hypothetical protein
MAMALDGALNGAVKERIDGIVESVEAGSTVRRLQLEAAFGERFGLEALEAHREIVGSMAAVSLAIARDGAVWLDGFLCGRDPSRLVLENEPGLLEGKEVSAQSELNSRTVHISDLYDAETRQRASLAIEFWFDHNQKQWLSREVAMDKNGVFHWTNRQWEDVQDLLRRSKLSRPAGTSFELTVTDMDIARQMMRLFFAGGGG